MKRGFLILLAICIVFQFFCISTFVSALTYPNDFIRIFQGAPLKQSSEFAKKDFVDFTPSNVLVGLKSETGKTSEILVKNGIDVAATLGVIITSSSTMSEAAEVFLGDYINDLTLDDTSEWQVVSVDDPNTNDYTPIPFPSPHSFPTPPIY